MESLEETKTFGRQVGTVVNLNVGGKLFTTSLETIALAPKDSFLSLMVSTRIPHSLDGAGNIFIDRDGTHFRHILNYLREAGLWSATSTSLTPGEMKELLVEVKFYGLETLVETLTTALVCETEKAKTSVTSIVVKCKTGAPPTEYLQHLLIRGFHIEHCSPMFDVIFLSGPAWNSDLNDITILSIHGESGLSVKIQPEPAPPSITIAHRARVNYSGGRFFRVY